MSFVNSDEEKIINIQIAPGKNKKILTLVIGIPEDRQLEVLQFLKKKFGCGGNIEKTKKYLQLQGNYKTTISSELKGFFGEYEIMIGSKK